MSSQSTTHRYPTGSIAKDYLMGGAGLSVVGLPLAATSLGPWMTGILGGFGILFAAYMVRTWIRSRTVIEVDEIGLRAHGPRSFALPWEQVRELELRYFSTRRDRQGGWMQLTVGNGSKSLGSRLSIESTLDAFPEVALKAGEAAERNGLALSEATVDNLRALATTGIPTVSVELQPGLRSGRPPSRPGDGPGAGRGGF